LTIVLAFIFFKKLTAKLSEDKQLLFFNLSSSSIILFLIAQILPIEKQAFSFQINEALPDYDFSEWLRGLNNGMTMPLTFYNIPIRSL